MKEVCLTRLLQSDMVENVNSTHIHEFDNGNL